MGKLFKFLKAELGLVAIISGAFIVFGYYDSSQLIKHLEPLNLKIATGFNNSNQNFELLMNKVLHLEQLYENLAENIHEMGNMQGNLRLEVRQNTETKVDKDYFWEEFHQLHDDMDQQIENLDDRVDILELRAKS